MKGSLKFYLRKGILVKDESVEKLSDGYITKAKNNLITLKILSEIQDDKQLRKKLNIPESYSAYEWVVIVSYYAMYTAAISLLAKIGYRSKNHSATLSVLEELFVKKKILEEKTLLSLKAAMFHKGEVEKLVDARHKREIAQYSITKQTTKTIAEKIEKDAYDFVDKCEEIIK
jgi:uncharacterized protein (UPF0332 family)